MFDEYSAYKEDFQLLEKLNLEKWENIPIYKEHKIGTVKIDGGVKIEIFVTGHPAQFYRAEIYFAGMVKPTIVRTGSGCLSDYWPSIEFVAEDMLVIEK